MTQVSPITEADLPSKERSPITAIIVAWIALTAFNLMFTRPATIVPFPVIPLFTLFLAFALKKERPELKSLMAVAIPISLFYIIFVFINTMYLGVQVRNLFEIEKASPLFLTLFYLMSFLSAGTFVMMGLTLLKTIHTVKGALLSLIITALIYAALFFGMKYLIDTYIVVKVKYLFVPELYEALYRTLN